MTATRLRLGKRAEDIVARWLSEKGWRILARNARTRFGELDIVALDDRTLVFLEVKAGRAGTAAGPERPVLSVGFRKQQRIRRLATAWMAACRDGPRYTEIRFDVAGVSFDRDGCLTEVEHIPNAF
jgi:putative endonuclease